MPQPPLLDYSYCLKCQYQPRYYFVTTTWVVSCPVYRFHSECNVSDTAEYTYQRQPAQPVARTRARQSQLRQPELSEVDQVEPETCKMCVKLYFNTLASTTIYIS